MDQQQMKQAIDVEEIKRLAPNYRGKPENFKPNFRKGKTNEKKSKAGPSTPNVTPPSNMDKNKNPTPQRNDSMITDAIFGPEMSGVEIHPLQTMALNFAKLRSISDEVFLQMATDEKMFDRRLVKEEFSYYTTALLWMRLIDIKAKEGRIALTSAEKEFRKMTEDDVYNVPTPIQIYLASIGALTDKGGKRTAVQDHVLPVAVAEGFGGYHANMVNAANHNMFEEIPSLGIAADAIMACATEGDDLPVNIRVPNELDLAYSQNLAGAYLNIGPRRPEIRQRLVGLGITGLNFPSTIANTRFYLKYVRMISDIIGTTETFRMERMTFSKMSNTGHIVQAIQTRPNLNLDEEDLWTEKSVQAESPEDNSPAAYGAANLFGFQLFKENVAGAPNVQTRNWVCVIPMEDVPVPAAWHENRNARRDLPPGLANARFRSIFAKQSVELDNIVRRLVKTVR